MRQYASAVLLLALSALGVQAVSSEEYASTNTQRWYSGNPFIVLDNLAFALNTGGNLVAIVPSNYDVLWNSGTTGYNCGNENCFVQWQGDGNFVLYEVQNGTPVPYFSSGTTATSAHPAATELLFQESAPYISLYGSSGQLLWETEGSNGHSGPSPPPVCERDEPGFGGSIMTRMLRKAGVFAHDKRCNA